MISAAKTVPAYLRELPEDRRAALALLRQEIRKAAPKAKESMKYGLPHYEENGPLFALASQKQYFSLYVAETKIVRAHSAGLAGLSVGKSCIRFRRADQIPMATIRKILRETVHARRARRVKSARVATTPRSPASAKTPARASKGRAATRRRTG